MLLEEGKIIRDTYKVDRFLGEGAFAEVYRVQHRFLGRQAMKVFKLPGTSIQEIEEKLSEAVILSRIGHPNIIRVFDAGVVQIDTGECGYFTMEYIAGGNLETFWRGHGPNFVPVADAVDIIRQVCNGLSIAHTEVPPIIHRDIKPQNILVGYDAGGLRIRVNDFGLAKKVNPLTLLASAKGTPVFKPPEFLLNMDSCAGDVWSIGATLYLLLTDRLPYPVLSLADFTSGKCFKRPFVPAGSLNQYIDTALDSIISRALMMKSTDRYPDAKAMLDDLIEWKSPEAVKSKRKDKGADEYKSALESSSQTEDTTAEELTAKALKLSQDASRITEAADYLEQALNRSPQLRGKYEYRLKLWRRGIIT